MAEDYESEPEGFLDRLRESPRTVSALIIILIVAAAIYAFSGDDQSQETPAEELAAVTEEAAMEDGAVVAVEGEVAAEVDEALPAPEPVSEEDIKMSAEELPQATRTVEGFTEVAGAGDGVTHLARRATTRWLAENAAGYEVTNEHRIYIEDYIKDHIGSQPLSLGATQNISFTMIADAVKAAGQLSDQQLRNLTPYAQSVSF